MVSSQIASLSEEDLKYLDELLHKEFSKQTERSTTWKSKNKYEDPCNKTKTLIKLMDAVRSQKKLLTMPKW